MVKIGTFTSEKWGTVTAVRTTYADGALAVLLELEDGEPLATLSVNMPPKSLTLPENCFYVKDWSENEGVAMDAAESQLFEHRSDLPAVRSGFIVANVWQIV